MGFEPKTFRPTVRRANHCATGAGTRVHSIRTRTGTPTSFSGMVYSRPWLVYDSVGAWTGAERHETMHYGTVWRPGPGKRTAWSVSLPDPAGPFIDSLCDDRTRELHNTSITYCQNYTQRSVIITHLNCTIHLTCCQDYTQRSVITAHFNCRIHLQPTVRIMYRAL